MANGYMIVFLLATILSAAKSARALTPGLEVRYMPGIEGCYLPGMEGRYTPGLESRAAVGFGIVP